MASIVDVVGSRCWVYLAFVRNSYLEMLAYRLRYVTGIITYLLFVSVHYFIWAAIFSGDGVGETVNGFTFPEMVTYVAIGWMARSLYFCDIDYEIEDLVRTGQVSNYLIRPVDFQLMMFARAIGASSFRLVFFTAPVSVVIMSIFPVMPPASLSAFLLFATATVTGFIILAEINFIVGLLAFSFKSIQGVIRAKYFVIQLFSGLLLPLAFFPDNLAAVMKLLPLKDIAFTPLQFYLGNYSLSEAPMVFFSQFLWIVVLLAIGRMLWVKAIIKLTLQGG